MIKKIRVYILDKIANLKLKKGDINGFNKTIYKIRDLIGFEVIE